MVITQRRHRNTYLAKVVQVLQKGRLAQHQSMTDVLGHQETATQVHRRSSFAAMRPERKRVQSHGLAQSIQAGNIRVQIVVVVHIRRIELVCPLLRVRQFLIFTDDLRLGLVVDRIKATNCLKNSEQYRVFARFQGVVVACALDGADSEALRYLPQKGQLGCQLLC